MKFRYVALVVLVLLVAGLAVFLAPVFNQPREKSGGNDSPEAAAKRDRFRQHMEEGREFLKAGRGAEAEAAFRQALSSMSNIRSPDGEAGLAEALFLQGKTQEALETYQGAVAEFGKGDPELLLQYGRFLDRAGLPNEAMSAYRRAFAVQPPGTFPVELPQNASAAEVRQKANQALALYGPPPPE